MAFALEDSPSPGDTQDYSKLEKPPIKYDQTTISILVGLNRPDILQLHCIVHTSRNGPYAKKRMFGWVISVNVGISDLSRISCSHVNIDESEISLKRQFEK